VVIYPILSIEEEFEAVFKIKLGVDDHFEELDISKILIIGHSKKPDGNLRGYELKGVPVRD